MLLCLVSFSNVKVIAFGKAVLGMVACLESLLGEHIVEGVASVPVGSMETAQAALSLNLPRENSHIRWGEMKIVITNSLVLRIAHPMSLSVNVTGSWRVGLTTSQMYSPTMLQRRP